jgi:predicted Zn-dependent peptidase
MPASVNKTTLNNNVRILTKKIPHARSVSMGVWVNVGARDESPRESGLSHFIEHMIFKGTQRRSAFQIAKEFDAIGGHTNAFTTMENTCYHAKVLDEEVETMVDILSDIFLNSVFDPKEVDRERPVILQEIGMVEDTPDEYVHLLLGLNFWGDNPLGRSILGPRENIMQFDSKSIKTFFRQLYQPERIVISAAGNINHDHFVDLLGPAFESIRSGSPFPERITPKGHSVFNPHYRKQEQVHICIGTNGLSITDPRRYCYSLLNTILGGNMSSRLFQEVRERRGLAYVVYSFVSSHVDTGMTGIYAGVDPSRTRETIRVILNEMSKLKQVRVDHSELNDAVAYTKGNLLLASESIENQMVRLAQNEIHLERYVPLKEVIDKIESTTPDDIFDLAGSLFQTDQLTVTLLGPITDKKSFEDILAFD